MPRPHKHRRIFLNPACYYFKPRGIPMIDLEEVVLEHDELEALRLADFLAFSHETAAAKMKISRATFGRIVEKARNKVADCLLNGKAIKINENYPDNIINMINKCGKCGNQINKSNIEIKTHCPKCKNKSGGSK